VAPVWTVMTSSVSAVSEPFLPLRRIPAHPNPPTYSLYRIGHGAQSQHHAECGAEEQVFDEEGRVADHARHIADRVATTEHRSRDRQADPGADRENDQAPNHSGRGENGRTVEFGDFGDNAEDHAEVAARAAE